jgi:hypothetical protein
MSKSLRSRLAGLEGSLTPVLGHIHVIYERDPADFAAQRDALIASGQAKARDFFFDWNFNRSPDQREFGLPETFPITQTHDERVLQWAKERI